MKIKKVYAYILPSLFTSGNLFCGFLSVYSVFNKRFVLAGWFILAAMVFDIMDGRVARMTKGTSNFGAEYDSLADLVSFGMAPAILIYFDLLAGSKFHHLGLFVAFIYLLCGAIRLARFNVSPTTDHFSGMPIPGGAAIIATIVILNSKISSPNFTGDIYFLLLFVALIGIMMVSSVPYPSLKKNKKNKTKSINNIVGIIFLLIVVTGIFMRPEETMFFMAISYAISGPVFSFYQLVKYNVSDDDIDLIEEINN